jgi:16S rRNA (guanine966-N2)-methyltransferase
VGCRFLDLFAGSGAVGIDAWSRGAAEVAWVEADRRVAGVLRENVRALCGLTAGIYEMRALEFLRKAALSTAYDVIYCDPPYAAGPGRERRSGARFEEILRAVAEGNRIAAGGVLVMETGAAEELPGVGGWRAERERLYGTSRVTVMIRETAS